ncbi:MAG: hypothetical protein LRY66_07025 [Saccharospirillaceae bacterium]|nr:hypothetical protein [Saccharospirillaceae bacterium]MCD8531104.1 hypothetical protein [Saccharospirillaceae bacterium]
MRYPIVFVTLAAALVLVTLNTTDTPILRGIHHPLPPSGDDAVSVETPDLILPGDGQRHDSSGAQPAADSLTPDVSEHPQRLNLTLPEMDWDDHSYGNSDAFPNLFDRRPKESVVHWSGRLHLDDSEEAETKPLKETILGAELELELKLP